MAKQSYSLFQMLPYIAIIVHLRTYMIIIIIIMLTHISLTYNYAAKAQTHRVIIEYAYAWGRT